MSDFKFKRDPLVSKLPITDPSVFIITTEFKNFVVGILKYRCLFKESTVSKYFDTEPSMKLIRQAFIHKSAGRTNYEYLELKGDPVVNLAVSDFIDTTFPNVTNVEWATRIFHNLKSGKTLARIAINNGFGEFLVYGDLMTKEIEKYQDNLEDSKLYLGMYEDTVEALFGAITIICKNKFPKESGRGISYNACYNLMFSYLSEIEIETSYEEAWDPVSRLKELADSKGWDKIKGCNFKNMLIVHEIGNDKEYNQLMWHYNKYINEYRSLNGPTVQFEGNRFIAFGYGCINGYAQLLSVVGSGSKKRAKHEVAENVIQKLNAMNIVQFSKFPDYDTWDFNNSKKDILIPNIKPVSIQQSSFNGDYKKLDNEMLCTLKDLVELDLSQNEKVNDRGLLCLETSKTLVSLNLQNNKKITNKGVSSLITLRSLDLENNLLISDVGIANLLELRRLNITNNTRITIRGLSKLTNLTNLELKGSNLDNYPSLGGLRQLLPKLKI